MALILCIETATPVCSVALVCDGLVIHSLHSIQKNAHSVMLNVFIDELMKTGGYSFNQLDAVAVSKGPGSYTGLRIGVSTAKGFCYALGLPLIAPGTLEVMAAGFLQQSELPAGALLCPMIDARRMEVYAAVFDDKLNKIRETDAVVMNEETFGDLPDDCQVYFFGDGASKCSELIAAKPNWHLADDFLISAGQMAAIASTCFSENKFEDVAYFEPFYLKDFVAAKANVKGLR
jgi:tRNA threonylcarbamoyladenosine biosynthesis protein TsaB